MTSKTTYDPVLEEMWAIKREIAAEYPTLDDYFKGMMEHQEQARSRGMKFVSFPPRRTATVTRERDIMPSN